MNAHTPGWDALLAKLTGLPDVARLAEMDRAYGEMIASAGKFDGSFERARERFQSLTPAGS